MAADFNEVADQFKKLVDSLREDPAQLISEDSVQFATDTVRRLQERTAEQSKFARQLGEEAILTRQITLLRKQQTFEAEISEGIGAGQLELVKQQLGLIQDQISNNNLLLEQVQSQSEEYATAVGHALDLTDVDRQLLTLEIEKAKLLGAHGELLPQIIESKMEEYEFQEKILKSQQAGLKVIEQERLLREQQEELLGFSVSSIKKKFRDSRQVLNTLTGRLTILGGALLKVLSSATTELRELRDVGLSVNQTFEAGSQILTTAFQGRGLAGILHLPGTLKSVKALRGEFADLAFQTNEVVESTDKIRRGFRISADSAAEVVEMLVKEEGLSAEARDHIFSQVAAFADINKLNPGRVLKSVADNAAIFARFGAHGAQAFFKAVGAAKRLGIELNKLDSVGDRLLDIDTLFADVSKLRTLGINISDPFGLAQAAQSDDPKKIAEELQRQLGNIDLTNLGGVQRRALESAFGLDLSEIARLQHGEISTLTEATDEQIDTLGNFDGGMSGAISILDDFTRSINFSTIALTAMAASALLNSVPGLARGAKGLLGGGGKLAGRLLGRGGTIAGLQSAAATAGSAATGAGATGAAAAGGASLAAIGGTIAVGLAAGLGIGELINRATGMRSIGDMMATRAEIKELEQRGAEADRQTAILRAQNKPLRDAIARGAGAAEIEQIRLQIKSGNATGAAAAAADATATAAAQTPAVEVATKEQMTELLEVFRKGFVVNIDGRKAGKLIATAQGPAF